MPDWLGQGHYLLTCSPERRRRISSYVYSLTCTALAHAFSCARGNATVKSQERKRERAGEIASLFLSEPKIALRYARDMNFAVIIRVRAGLSRDTIPEA